MLCVTHLTPRVESLLDDVEIAIVARDCETITHAEEERRKPSCLKIDGEVPLLNFQIRSQQVKDLAHLSRACSQALTPSHSSTGPVRAHPNVGVDELEDEIAEDASELWQDFEVEVCLRFLFDARSNGILEQGGGGGSTVCFVSSRRRGVQSILFGVGC